MSGWTFKFCPCCGAELRLSVVYADGSTGRWQCPAGCYRPRGKPTGRWLCPAHRSPYWDVLPVVENPH